MLVVACKLTAISMCSSNKLRKKKRNSDKTNSVANNKNAMSHLVMDHKKIQLGRSYLTTN